MRLQRASQEPRMHDWEGGLAVSGSDTERRRGPAKGVTLLFLSK